VLPGFVGLKRRLFENRIAACGINQRVKFAIRTTQKNERDSGPEKREKGLRRSVELQLAVCLQQNDR
jgi:hypothetical protein